MGQAQLDALQHAKACVWREAFSSREASICVIPCKGCRFLLHVQALQQCIHGISKASGCTFAPQCWLDEQAVRRAAGQRPHISAQHHTLCRCQRPIRRLDLQHMCSRSGSCE